MARRKQAEVMYSEEQEDKEATIKLSTSCILTQ